MGLFDMFLGKKEVPLDQARSDGNKARMREIFDREVESGADYKLVYAYSEDVRGANFAVLRFPISTEVLLSVTERVT